MTYSFFWLFIPACFVLNAAPGPNNLLAFSNASRLGLGYAMLGALGRLPAFAAMIALVAAGLGALLAVSEFAFSLVKYAGAAYLIYIGWKMWRAQAQDVEFIQGKRTAPFALMRREFLVASANPKAIAIFTAFFPQFVDFNAPLGGQFLLLGALFLLLEISAALLYALLGLGLSRTIGSERNIARLTQGVGAFLILSGIMMAFGKRS